MRYAPNKCRIGRTPEYWDAFRSNYRARAVIIGKTPAPDYNVSYPEDIEDALPQPSQEVPKFAKRNQKFNIPIFGKEMKFNMQIWEHGYIGAFSAFKNTYVRTDKAGRTYEVGEYIIPFCRSGNFQYNWSDGGYLTGSTQDPYPDPDEYFNYTLRFGMHCHKRWYEIVGAWIMSLECVRAHIDLNITYHRFQLHAAKSLDGFLTPTGLHNTGESPVWSRGLQYIGEVGDVRTEYDVGGSIWHSNTSNEISSGELVYNPSWPYIADGGTGVSQRGQYGNGDFWQDIAACIESSTVSVLVMAFPNDKISYGNIQMKDDPGVSSTGKIYGFSVGRKYEYTQSGGVVESPGFDGAKLNLEFDDKKMAEFKIGESTETPAEPYGFVGVPFEKSFSIDSVKKEVGYKLSSDSFAIPSDCKDGLLLGWDGGVQIYNCVLSIDISAKLDLLE